MLREFFELTKFSFIWGMFIKRFLFLKKLSIILICNSYIYRVIIFYFFDKELASENV